MVVQLHMRPGDKPETVQTSIGLFFTDKPPVKEAFKIILDAPTLDIPAGEKDYIATDSLLCRSTLKPTLYFHTRTISAKSSRICDVTRRDEKVAFADQTVGL